jgi:hypothetical protein
MAFPLVDGAIRGKALESKAWGKICLGGAIRSRLPERQPAAGQAGMDAKRQQ